MTNRKIINIVKYSCMNFKIICSVSQSYEQLQYNSKKLCLYDLYCEKLSMSVNVWEVQHELYKLMQIFENMFACFCLISTLCPARTSNGVKSLYIKLFWSNIRMISFESSLSNHPGTNHPHISIISQSTIDHMTPTSHVHG